MGFSTAKTLSCFGEDTHAKGQFLRQFVLRDLCRVQTHGKIFAMFRNSISGREIDGGNVAKDTLLSLVSTTCLDITR
jgi:hypothetical protein